MFRSAMVLLILALAGCSTTTADSADSGSPESNDAGAGNGSDSAEAGLGVEQAAGTPSGLCAAAQKIRDLDDEVSASGNEMMLSITRDDAVGEAALRDLTRQIEGLLPEVSAAYDELRREVPADLVADVDLVKSFTIESVDILVGMDFSADMESEFTSQIDPQAAQGATEAVLRIDELTRQECGVTLAG